MARTVIQNLLYLLSGRRSCHAQGFDVDPGHNGKLSLFI
jgi:hypothetical protein